MFGVTEAKALFERYKDRPILVYGDPDVDGLISMLLVCQFLESQGLQYRYYVNNDRQHGFLLKPEKLRGYLVLSVDFDAVASLPDLVENDVVIISFDHHEIQSEPVKLYKGDELRAVVINNQYPFEPEIDRYLSGAGVFYEAITAMYPEFQSEERVALVGITLLSDIRAIEFNDKARAYLQTTYTIDTTKGYMKYLVESVGKDSFVFGIPKMDCSYINYRLSPKVNSLLRFDLTDEAVNFILGKGLRVHWTNERQSEIVRIMRERAKFREMQNYTAIAVDESDFKEFEGVKISSFIGMLASRVKGVGKSVLAFTHKDGVVTRASFRGRYDEVRYREAFEQIGVPAHGHGVAFGIPDFAPTKQTWEQIDRIIGDLDKEHVLTVKIRDVSNLSFFLLREGNKVATENCFVRDMFRTYIRYTGSNIKITKESYKTTPLTAKDYQECNDAETTVGGKPCRYVRDSDGNKIVKFREYTVDGHIVKSFGLPLEGNLILPIIDRGTLALFVRESVE